MSSGIKLCIWQDIPWYIQQAGPDKRQKCRDIRTVTDRISRHRSSGLVLCYAENFPFPLFLFTFIVLRNALLFLRTRQVTRDFRSNCEIVPYRGHRPFDGHFPHLQRMPTGLFTSSELTGVIGLEPVT